MIPTAEEWLKHFEENAYPGTPISECMIEFAQMHVQAAIKAAAENASAYVSTDDEPTVSKGSIFSAYRLSNKINMSFAIKEDPEDNRLDLVGLKVKGFKFDGFPAFVESTMTQYIDVIGTITSCQERACSITFYNADKFHSTDTWQYPYPEILDYLILEETFEEEKHKLTEIENLKNLKNYESRTTTATSKVSSF